MEKSPSSPAFFPLASLIWQQGEGPRAEKLLRSGLGVHAGYAPARVLLGEVLLAMDRPQEAAEELAAAVKKSPWNLQGQRLLAECRKRSGDEAGAKRALRVAAMFDPSDPESRALLDEAPRPAPAAAGKGAPTLPDAEAPAAVPTPSLAQLYTSQGHHAQAAEVYRQLLQKEPANAEWRRQLALLEARLGGSGREAPPAARDLDMDFEAEIAAPAAGGGERGEAQAGPSTHDDADLDALLSEVQQTEAALPRLDEEDERSIQEIAGKAAAGAPVGDAGLEDDLEALLGAEDELAGAPTPKVAAGPAPDAVLDEDLENLFADEEAGPAAAAPVAPEASGGAAGPDAVLDEDLESLFAEDVEESGPAPTPAAPAHPPAAAAGAEVAGDELDLAALLEEETGTPAGAAQPAPAAHTAGEGADVLLDEDLEDLFAEDGAEAVPATPLAAGPGEEPSLDLDMEVTEGELDLLAEGGGAGGADELELEEIAASAESGEAPQVPAPQADGVEVDPVLRNLIGLYVEEGNLAQALDLCRKVSSVGAPSGWLAGRIREIEARLAAGAGAQLQESAKGDKEGEVRSLSPAEVVERLEGWLQTLRLHKARVSASQ